MHALAELIDRHGVDVLDHLDREATVPVLAGLQRQGDVLVVPAVVAALRTLAASTKVPASGTPVVRGENGGNTHAIVADGLVFCDVVTARGDELRVAVLTVPDGSVAYLAHPEHGYVGIAPGTYELRRQREQAEVARLVAD